MLVTLENKEVFSNIRALIDKKQVHVYFSCKRLSTEGEEEIWKRGGGGGESCKKVRKGSGNKKARKIEIKKREATQRVE